MKYLPTSISFMIFNLNPIFVALIAPWFLNELFELKRIFYIIGAFIGIFLVAMGRNQTGDQNNSGIIGIGLALGAAILTSIAYTSMRSINQEVHHIFSPYYL
jgi:drug/metabolite transporter (DMT)-like permease